MNSIHTQKLSSSQKQDLLTLAAHCKDAETLSLSAPTEDGLDYFLLYEDHLPVSMLFLFFPERTVCECGAFTLPSHRRKGCFSRLLEDALAHVEALEEQNGLQIDFCFLADEHTPSASATLQAIGAEYWYSEYSMKRFLSPADAEYHTDLLIREAEPGLYTASAKDELIGTCILLPTGRDIYFYGFEIREPFRGRGYGCDFLSGMLALLSRSGVQSISLQVSGQNHAALSLYHKTGFQITETLSYYLY